MREMNMKKVIWKTLRLVGPAVLGMLLAATALAAAPGIGGTGAAGTFALTAEDSYLNQPDGSAVYSWGYGCASAPAASMFYPQINGAPMAGSNCPTMQVPGPTLIVNEGASVQVTLTNNLPLAAGNTSILFPGFNVKTSCNATTPVGVQGLLTCEATPGGGSVTYTFQATSSGTRAYYSGTQGDLQIEMGLYGAIIVLPSAVPAGCVGLGAQPPHYVPAGSTAEADFRLAASAYRHSRTCYDREYLFQFSEMNLEIHNQALAQ